MKRSMTLALGIMVFLLSYSTAATADWSTPIPKSNYYNEGRGVIQTNDGYFIVGSTASSILRSSTSPADAKILCAKTNANGNVLSGWPKALPNNGTGGDVAYGVKPTNDGNYMIAGFTTCSPTAGNRDVLLMKVSPNGDVIWRNPSPIGTAGDDRGYSLQRTSDGGYIIAGVSAGDVYLVRTNGDGQLQWQHPIPMAGYQEAYCARQTSDGGYIVAGITDSGAGGWDGLLIKTDASGNLIPGWSPKTFGGSANDQAYSAEQTSDGYIVAGVTGSYSTHGSLDAWLIKTNTSGIIASGWPKTFGSSGDDYFYSVKVANDGGYFVAGSYGTNGIEAWALKTDSNGGQTSESFFGGTGYDFAWSVEQTSDDGCVVAGTTDLLGANAKALLAKVSPPAQTKIPVVIIPGIMGTYLYNDTDGDGTLDRTSEYCDDELIWIDSQIDVFKASGDTYLDVLALCPDGSNLNPSCKESDVNVDPADIDIKLSKIFAQDDSIGGALECNGPPLLPTSINYYGSLIGYLDNQGYSPGTDLLTFPYDWRKDIADQVNTLDNIIGSFPQVDIVAHSMGGILARYYANTHQSGKVRRIIFVGTPQAGSVDAYKSIITGDAGEPLNVVLAQDEAKKLMRNFPSAHQLLPNAKYLSAFGISSFLEIKEFDWNAFPFSQPYSVYPTLDEIYGPDYSSYLEEEYRVPNPGLKATDFWNGFPGGDTVNAKESFTIIGYGEPTVTGYIINNEGPYSRVFANMTNYGDGRVPIESAMSVGTTRTYYAEDFEHSKYFINNDSVGQLIYSLLTAPDYVYTVPPAGISTSIADSRKNWNLQVILACPAEIQVFDSSGNRDGMNEDGTITTGIPKSLFEVIAHTKSVVLANPDDYSMVIKGLEAGTFALFLNMTDDEGHDIFNQAYLDIPIIQGSIAQIDYALGDTTTALSLDNEGDGVFEETYPPEPLPIIVTTPTPSVNEGEQYHYQVYAIAKEGDVVVYSLLEAPTDMIISDTGLISWMGKCGPSHVVVRVTGGDGDYDIQEFDRAVIDPNPPAITAPPDITVTCSGQPINLGAPTATDTCCDVTVTNNAPAVFPIGETVVTWTATDCNGNSATTTQKVRTVYEFSGVLQPINTDGSSIFKAGQTIPVKFKLYCSGASPARTATATLSIFKVANTVTGSVEEVSTVSSGEANTGNLFRYDPVAQQYIYNWSTKGLSAGTYQLRIGLDDGTIYIATLSLKSK